MPTVSELFSRLDGDSWRITHPFSKEILEANALLHNSAATDDEMAECMNLWCSKFQSCQFGKIAANRGGIHFCFLRESAVANWTDEEISEKIDEERRLWKQRAAFDPSRAAHSFMIVVASHRVSYTPPRQDLRAFADRILELSGWEPDRRGARRRNTVTSDYLYLRKPDVNAFYGFRFNLDFFACTAEGHWWHDHSLPGGIAFTANSTGHMMRHREWYQQGNDSPAWALKQAMLTVANAARVDPRTGRVLSRIAVEGEPDGVRATWLRKLSPDGKAWLNVACPVASMPTALQGMDWTRYEGTLHTDHAVREEFFVEREMPPTASSPYLMDFSYLYDATQPDFQDFSGGKPFTEEEIFAEIGRPEDWTHRSDHSTAPRSDEDTVLVAQQLTACRAWQELPSPADLLDDQ